MNVKLWNGDASHGHASGDTLNGIENLTCSAFADNRVGDAGANTLAGGDGDDRLRGAQAADTFVFAPGTGADTVTDFENDGDQLDLTPFDFGGGDNVAFVGFAKSDFNGGDVVL